MDSTNTQYATVGRDREPSIIETHAQELERLAAVINDLESRLGPVMRPAYDGPPEKAGGVPMPAQSAIRDQLNNLSYQTTRLSQLVERLEV